MMNFISFRPTLEYRASVRIAVTLWNQEYARTSMIRHHNKSFDSSYKEWHEIEDIVYEKVKKLLKLPVSIRDKVSRMVHPIGMQIFKWKLYHQDVHEYLNISLPSELCWTSQGTVDQKRTAEMLVKDENLNIASRYKLSCIYCLEEDITALWNKLPECHRLSFYHEDNIRSKCQQLVMLWTNKLHKQDYVIIGSSSQHINSPNLFACEVALKGGNEPATEYFFQKLTPKEKEESLLEYVHMSAVYHDVDTYTDYSRQNYADIFCFLVSQMTKEEQIKYLKSDVLYSLLCLLDWPYQCVFIDTARNLYDSLDNDDLDCLLWVMGEKIVEDGNRDDTSKLLFSAFWQQILPYYKDHIVGRSKSDKELISLLLNAEDKGNVKLLLSEMTVIQREELIFCCEGKDICHDLAYNKQWDMMKFFILQCVETKESMLKWQKEFNGYAKSKTNRVLSEDLWGQCSKLIDELISTYAV